MSDYTNLAAIRYYFEAPPHGRKVTIDELVALSPVELAELAYLVCCEILPQET